MIKLLILALTLFSASAAAQDQSVSEFIQEVKGNASKKIEPIKEDEIYRSEDYTMQGLRSPFSKTKLAPSFASSGTITETGGIIVQMPRPDANRVREYLERYQLSSFHMVGTLRKKGSTWSLVQDNTGMVHAVKVGDYIGENSGRVVKIGEEQIDVLETVPNGEGGWMELKSEIGMQTQEYRSDDNVENQASK